MDKDVSESFENYFGKLKDSRIERKKLYPLVEVLFVVLSGSICGTESWRDYVLFGKAKLDFLKEYYLNISYLNIHLNQQIENYLKFHTYLNN